MSQDVVRAGEIAAAMNRARGEGYYVIRWPEHNGGGFLAWKDDEWLLIGCQSERWRKAWNVEADGHLRAQP